MLPGMQSIDHAPVAYTITRALSVISGGWGYSLCHGALMHGTYSEVL